MVCRTGPSSSVCAFAFNDARSFQDPRAGQPALRTPYTGTMSKQYSAPPSMTIDPARKFSATFDTSKGIIVCDLFAKDAPKTVNNFVLLARQDFYNDTVF